MRRTLFASTVIAVALSGCVASHTWAPGPHQSAANFTEVKGRCELLAAGADNGGGFAYAQGSPQFVGSYLGAAAVASAIDSHNRQQSVMNACMEANGFVIADNGTTGTPNSGIGQRQYQATLSSRASRALEAVITDREAFGIVGASEDADEDALRRCILEDNGGAEGLPTTLPQTEATEERRFYRAVIDERQRSEESTPELARRCRESLSRQ
jgi:hypothetical protein